MITVKKACLLHDELINRYGGSKGVRDIGLLEAALARPYATYDGRDLYATPVDKASAIFESLIINHPFIDGNKRIAYTLMRLILIEGGQDIIATYDDKLKMVIAASEGTIRFEEIKDWLSSNLTTNQ